MTQTEAALIAKPRLTIQEIARLLAEAVGALPTVLRVDMVDDSELSVSLACGSHIEVQTLPIAARMNASPADRQAMLDDILRRCA